MRSTGLDSHGRFDLDGWLVEVASDLEALKDLDLGYPLGENAIRFPGDEISLRKLLESSVAPAARDFIEFYRRCDGLNLPDVHVGYFLHPLRLVLDSEVRGEPVRISGVGSGEILTFGSDGGGGKFALRRNAAGEVLYLAAGAVHSGVFDGERTPARVLSDSFSGFLAMLGADIRAFVEGRSPWRYLV